MGGSARSVSSTRYWGELSRRAATRGPIRPAPPVMRTLMGDWSGVKVAIVKGTGALGLSQDGRVESVDVVEVRRKQCMGMVLVTPLWSPQPQP